MRRLVYIVIVLGLIGAIVYGLWKRRGGDR
jgi:hypothetical protein